MRTWTRLSQANRLEQRFSWLRQRNRKALLVFVPAGDPHLAATRDLLETLAACGADVIELGFPYSDPIADGPLIQASYTRALSRGIRLQETLDLVADCLLTGAVNVPVMAMVSYSLVFRQSERGFVERCARAGFSGLIVPDLPAEEASSLVAACRENDLGLIQLVAPTTPPHRVRQIVQQCSGFVYCVSVTGITGIRERLPEELRQRLLGLRQETDLPICVGFGISRPEHIYMLNPYADGVIVGSALVSRLAEADRRPWHEITDSIAEFVRQLRQALDTATPVMVGQLSPPQQPATQ